MSIWNWFKVTPKSPFEAVSYFRQRRRAGTRSRNVVTGIEQLEIRQLLSVDSLVRIADQTNGGPDLSAFSEFGRSVTAIGDVNGDGVVDLAVGAASSSIGDSTGVLRILFMKSDGTVDSFTTLSSGANGAPTLAQFDNFSRGVTAIGDLDGDLVPDLAVGAPGDDTGGDGRGAVYILFLNSNGTIKSFNEIAHETDGGPTLANGDEFGRALTAIGDIDGDAVTDLAVAAPFDDTSNSATGAVYIVRLNTDGTAKSTTKIASQTNGFPLLLGNDRLGNGVASLGDIDGDAVNDLGIGAPGDPNGGLNLGTAYVVLMNANGTVKSSTKVVSGANGGPTILPFASFGTAVGAAGDADGDGVPDMLVGAINEASSRGGVYTIYLNDDGSIKGSSRIASGLNGGPTLASGDEFGYSIASIGDLNLDGITDLAVGAPKDSISDSDSGALYILFLNDDVPVLNTPPTIAINGGPVTFVKGDAPIAIAPAVTLNDVDTDPDFQIPGGQLIFSINTIVANKKGTKLFDTLNVSSLSSVAQLGSVGNPSIVNGRVQYIVGLSDSVTVAQIQDALRGVTFSTTKKGLKTATRDIQMRISDKSSLFSSVVTQTINVSKKRIAT